MKITQEELNEILRKHEEWIIDDTSGARADLQGADLQGADLRGVSLQGAYLRRANLRGADLRWADLQGADLQEADLREADLREADLIGIKVNENIKGLATLEQAIQNLDKIGGIILAKPDLLDMSRWHSDCGTAHCIAGWAEHLFERAETEGNAHTVGIKHCWPAAHMFFGDNERVLEFFKNREYANKENHEAN